MSQTLSVFELETVRAVTRALYPCPLLLVSFRTDAPSSKRQANTPPPRTDPRQNLHSTQARRKKGQEPKQGQWFLSLACPGIRKKIESVLLVPPARRTPFRACRGGSSGGGETTYRSPSESLSLPRCYFPASDPQLHARTNIES